MTRGGGGGGGGLGKRLRRCQRVDNDDDNDLDTTSKKDGFNVEEVETMIPAGIVPVMMARLMSMIMKSR